MAMSAILDTTRGGGLVREGRSKQSPFDLKGLQRIGHGDEPIEMEELRHSYFPLVFTWRGRRYDVYAVERCWTISRRGLGGKVERYCFRIRAQPRSGDAHAEETFEIYQDVQHNTWHMQRQIT